MKAIVVLVGFLMLVTGFIWYRTSYWNTNFFDIVGEGISFLPALVPLGIGVMGFIVLIYGLSPKEKKSLTTLEQMEKERTEKEMMERKREDYSSSIKKDI